MAAQRSLYEILNVSPSADVVVIEAAYRALIKKYHPDQSAVVQDGSSAAQINHAFATLRNAERRADYDRRQWLREQELMLIPHSPPPLPPRQRAVFGWGGWVLAAMLGGVLAMMAGRVEELSTARAEAVRAALAAEPDPSSQPTLPEEEVVPPEVVADIQREAFGLPAPQPTVVPEAPSESGAESEVGSQDAPPDVVVTRTKPPRRRPQPRRAVAPSEKDFLEREGYIY